MTLAPSPLTPEQELLLLAAFAVQDARGVWRLKGVKHAAQVAAGKRPLPMKTRTKKGSSEVWHALQMKNILHVLHVPGTQLGRSVLHLSNLGVQVLEEVLLRENKKVVPEAVAEALILYTEPLRYFIEL